MKFPAALVSRRWLDQVEEDLHSARQLILDLQAALAVQQSARCELEAELPGALERLTAIKLPIYSNQLDRRRKVRIAASVDIDLAAIDALVPGHGRKIRDATARAIGKLVRRAALQRLQAFAIRPGPGSPAAVCP